MKILPSLPGLLLTSAVTVLVASPAWAQQIVQVTGVQLKQTPNGLEVILETANGMTPQVFTSSSNQAFVADLANAQLRLPQGKEFRTNNPVAGIAQVSVTNVTANSVRVMVTGTAAVPKAEVVPSPGTGLLFSLLPGGQTAEQQPAPAPTAPETPTAQPEGEQQPETELEAQPEQPAVADDEEAEAINVIVTATRTEEQVENVPRSVTVVNREQVEQQAALSQSRNLQDILGQLVPGYGPPAQSPNLATQSLRGRAPQVLIDGVPIKSNLSTVQARDLRSIDPSAVERIEVVRGPSAIYGDGGTGGVINIITRQPTDQELTSSAEIAVDFSTTNPEDSFGNYLEYSLSGRQGNVDFLGLLSRQSTGGFFDAEGDRVPRFDETADTETFNVLGKVGVDLNEEQRLQLTVNHFDDSLNSNIRPDPVTEELPGIQKARALELPDPEYVGFSNPRILNTVVSLAYDHDNLWGSRVQAQAYYRNNVFSSSGFDERPFGSTNPGISAQENEREQFGARLQIDSPLSQTLSLLWGADYANEEASIIIAGFDEQDFDLSGGRTFRQVEELIWTPPYDFTNLGLFAQLQWDASDRWSVNGGLRYERFGLSVDDYTVLTFTDEPGQNIEGGDVNFDDVLFNIGVVYNVTDEIGLYANFAQGFSAPDFGRLLRNPPEEFTSVEEDLDVTSPQKVDNYEVGIRGTWSNVQASLAGFYNESDLGVIVTPSAELLNIATVARESQRLYGIEATLDWQPGAGWGLGGSVSWVEGEFEDEDEYLPLNSGTIQPLKLTAYVEHETKFGWRNRLQALFAGNRNRAFEDDVDPVPIDSYITVDFISSIPLFGGTLSLGVENLFNEQYTPAYYQYIGGFSDIENLAGRGRTLRIGYSIDW